ncbi:NAD-binding protein (plasmid) [Photobacterium sp. GJ3]|uniref:potassium channel family protein n=1 Tax=Photobacterium sp. GJ3 TaxID=2829502 RepID=UPI001B8C1CD9|nr:potassium channel family protein [Photobacterium sp. GJ3]QUJ69609.1 NAD-binding protein [Photobacterium sp. GJ3]
MTIWLWVRRWAHQQFNQLNGRNLLMTLVIYVGLSWILLELAGEQDLTHSASRFIYYLVVTASTVGYGDFSPQTIAGQWVVSLFVIPGGLGLFAIGIGRLATVFISYWKSSLLGKRRINVENHILVLGWNHQRTLHLIKMLQHEERTRRHIVLCVRPEMENPLPGEIDFVRVVSFTDTASMDRAGIGSASCIIIDNEEDDVTLAAALYCASRNPQAHLLAYFHDETLSDLLKSHCPNAECIPSVAVEMLAKAAVDPGSSGLHHELLSTHHGMTQYAVRFPANGVSTPISQLFTLFKAEHDATLIGIDRGDGIELNPALDLEVTPGTNIFYIADERIDQFNWPD